MTPKVDTRTVRGCRIRLMEGGDGAPLLFLHGGGGASVWLPFMDRLASEFRVIVPEHPGFGGSDTPAWLDNIHDLAYFYLDFLKEAGLGPVHLVGTSVGGWIAAELAVRSTSAVKSLSLIAPAGLHIKGQPKGDIFMWTPEESVRNIFHDQSFADAMLARQLTEDQQMEAQKNRMALARVSWQPRLYDPDLPKWLHRIDIPTQLIWGENDRVFPPAYAEGWRQLIPGSRATILPACGHLPLVEKAAETVALVSGFAKECSQ